MAKTKEEKREISRRVDDILKLDGINIIKKLNECFLNFNLNELGLIVNKRTDVDDFVFRGFFPKYSEYRNKYRLGERHLIKNDFFDEFSVSEFRFSITKRCLIRTGEILYADKIVNDTQLDNIIDEYIGCLESFSEYIGYDMKISKDGEYVYFKKNKVVMNRVENYLNGLTKRQLITLLESFGASISELDIARASVKKIIVAHIMKNHFNAAADKLDDLTDDKINDILD